MNPHRRPSPNAFTLVELLVVIGIITIVSLIAVPAFRTMTGQRSTESATNQLAGLLGRARADAIGLQEIRGVGFFIDPETQRVQAVLVKQAQYPTAYPPPSPTVPPAPELFLDYVEDRDPVLLPQGVGIQMIDDTDYTAMRENDRYIGFNLPVPATLNMAGGAPSTFTYGGVILFDSYGRIVTKRYGFKCYVEDGAGVKSASALAKAWGMDAMPSTLMDSVPPGTTDLQFIRSQFGFVVFNSEEYAGMITGPGNLKDLYQDPQITGMLPMSYTTASGPTGIAETAEEKWLDDNATPQLVNRNNGTLVKGE